MASRKELEVGIRIGATNDTQAGINSALNSFSGLANGLAGSAISIKGMAAIGETIDQYSSKESALARVRIMTMKVGDAHTDVYNKEVKYIEDLSSKYTGSIEDYAKMQATLLRYRISPEDIMGGIGDAAAKLGVVFEVPADKAAAFFGKMKNDFDVMPGEMNEMADMLSKVHRMGVGLNGEDAINEMTQAFSKEGLAVRNLGMHGAKAVEDLGLLSAIFINTGQTGQSVGTNLRRILEGAINPGKAGKVKMNAKALGIDIDFTDGHGQFAGVDKFVSELSKLKGLSTEQLYSVLNPLAGKQGLSTSMDVFMGKFGEVEFSKYKTFKDSLIGINDEFKVLQETLAYITKTKDTNIENLKAAIGGSMAPDLKRVNTLIGEAATGLKHFTDEHPQLATMTTEFTAAGLGLGAIVGGIRTLAALNPAFASIAAGLTNAFLPLMAATAAFLILKAGADNAEKRMNEELASGQPLSMASRNNQYFDEKIKAADAAEGIGSVFDSASWRLIAGLHGATGMLGDGFYNFAAKNYAPTDDEMKYDRTHFAGMSSMAEAQGWNKKMYGPENSSAPQISFSPIINMQGSSMNEQTVTGILTNQVRSLWEAFKREDERQKYMTYGK